MDDNQEKHLRQKAIEAALAYYQLKKSRKKSFSPGELINYGGRIYDEAEISNLIDASLDFWLTAGSYCSRFEREFADFLEVKYCSLVNSGSSANLLAFMALTSEKLGARRIMPGDEIITVAVAFPTTVAPIVQYGAIPVFLDVKIPSYNIDVNRLEAALSTKTKAIMIAHTMGNPFDLVEVKQFCENNHLWLIEDNCDALGSKVFIAGRWQYTGTIGDLGTSSFYPPHHMTMGEGGAVYTNNRQLKRIVDSMRDWGRDCWCGSGKDNTCDKRFSRQFGELPFGYDHKYVYSHFGYNLKVTEMQAAIGCAQLAKLPEFIKSRKINWQILHDGLADLADFFFLPEASAETEPSWFGFALTVKNQAGITRDGAVHHLESCGIQTRMLFAGNLLRHPCFGAMKEANKGFRVVMDLQVTDQIMRDTFWLGVYSGLSTEMVDYVIRCLRQYVFLKRG